MYRQVIEKIPAYCQKIVVYAIKGYRFVLSPWLGNQCRFYPSCSHYAETAIMTHGVVKGAVLGVYRILKCNPFHPGGVDFVPELKTNNKQAYEYTKNT